MKHKDLFSSLKFFEKIREDLIESFRNEENFNHKQPEIYGAMFKYEKNESVMQLMIEKFSYHFVDQHIHIFEQDFSSDFLKKFLLPQMQFFFDQDKNLQIKSKNLTQNTISFLAKMSQSREKILQKFVEFKEKNHKNREQIKAFIEKRNALFNREIEKYIEKENI